MKNTFALLLVSFVFSHQALAQGRPHIVQQYKEANPTARVAQPVDHTDGQARMGARGVGLSSQTMTAERATATATATRLKKAEVVQDEEALIDEAEELADE